METKPPIPDPHAATLEDSGDLSNFFNDVRMVWARYGNQITVVLLVGSLSFLGYNLVTKRSQDARQNAWIDLYSSNSPDSLALAIERTNNPAVRAIANLRAGDLLLDEANTASEQDAQAILATAAGHYQAVLDQAPHVVYELNALDGLAVVAESRFEGDRARELYQQLKDRAADQYPYWAGLAERRLALLPTLSEAVAFAPEATPEPGPDLLQPAAPATSDTPPAPEAEVSPESGATPGGE